MSARSSPRVLAHRGASGHACENSLEAFRLARRLGADGIELDVHATADGALVVHHDPVLPGQGWIRDLSRSEVRGWTLPNGESPPTLAEALGAAPGLEVWVELKALGPEGDSALLEALSQGPDPDRYGVHSFDHRLIARLHRAAPRLRLGILTTAYLLEPIAALGRAGATALWQEWSLVDGELVTQVHGAGAEVIAWTVNDVEAGRQLASLGVDALFGNYPERLRQA